MHGGAAAKMLLLLVQTSERQHQASTSSQHPLVALRYNDVEPSKCRVEQKVAAMVLCLPPLYLILVIKSTRNQLQQSNENETPTTSVLP